jgi:DNA gyrase/topoisomerase IV subunit A
MNNKIELHNIFTTNYTEYAKYTITDRAIPSLEDGCKNIHRRILWSMYVNKNTHDKNRVKANTAVGLCMGYSPHGNTSIYGAMVRFANDSVNLNLIDGKGAFSTKTSRDVDAGADRYVEVRLAPITQEYLKDIDKNIGGMKNNYDETKLEPIYLPVTFPTILCNPNLGIATGIASNICAFPLEDVIDNTINIIDNKEMKLMIPTFSTGGELIYNEKILKQIQDTGTGKLILNSKYEIKDDLIVVTEIPYTTTREVIIEKIIDLVKEGKTKSILDVNDHTGKDGLKITIKAKKNTNMEQLVQYLFKKTTLRDTFSCNFNVLDNNIPKTLGTKEY